MVERAISVEVLQQRSDAIILGMRRAVSGGMNPQFFRYLEEESPRKHRDLVQVYLGIKPCASHILEVLDDYGIDAITTRDDAKYLGYFPKAKDTEVTVLTDSLSCSVWNPALVNEVLRGHQDLQAMVTADPFDRLAFGNLLERFYTCSTDMDILLQGVIFGYPRAAVEMFVKYNGMAVTDADTMWRMAEEREVAAETPPPSLYQFDLHDKGGILDPEIKREFVRLAEIVGYPKTDVIEYVEGLHAADIPGWQYFTSGDVTATEERRIRDQFAASQFDDKYARFLHKLGV